MSEFTIRLDTEDWKADVGGWFSSAFSIPGIKISSVYVGGQSVDSARYELKDGHLRWPEKEDRPEEVTVSLGLAKNLVTSEKAIKWAAVLVPLLSILLTAAVEIVRDHMKVPPPGPEAEVWIVRGNVLFQDEAGIDDQVTFSFKPSHVQRFSRGRFQLPVLPTPLTRDLPDLLVFHSGYRQESVNLESLRAGTEDRSIQIPEPIVLKPVP